MLRSFVCSFLLGFLFMLLLLLIPPAVSAQSVEQIRVKKVKWEVSITAADSIFRVGLENMVTIKVKGGDNYAINVKGGTIAKQQDKYVVYAKEEGAVTVCVYEKLPDKKMRVLGSKLFMVKRVPPPQIMVCGVRTDSVIDRQQIIQDDIVTAYHPFYKVHLPVVGFDVVFPNKDISDKLSSANNHFTPDMRRRIYSLKPGTLLYFENVYYLLPDGRKEKAPGFQVFVAETNKYNVGYRVMGL